MLHHERLRPPSHDYPADEWNAIEKGFHPEFLAQLETMLALGNGYLGMRGSPEEGGPSAENSTLINGFSSPALGGTWMLFAYGFGGMRDNDGRLSFWPRRAPQENGIIRFSVTYHGQMLEIEIVLDKVEYRLIDGEELAIRHEAEEVRLTRERVR
jgi:trehalose/maltose hydrolase-like predicted phosphorylase